MAAEDYFTIENIDEDMQLALEAEGEDGYYYNKTQNKHKNEKSSVEDIEDRDIIF